MNKTLEIFKKHRNNLEAATTLEEWKSAHLKFLDYLIAKDEADAQRESAYMAAYYSFVGEAPETVQWTYQVRMETSGTEEP